jgi:dienelactone hydrolase
MIPPGMLCKLEQAMNSRAWIVLVALLAPARSFGQAEPRRLAPIFEQPILRPETAGAEWQRYLIRKVPVLAAPPSAEHWTRQASELRRRLLEEVVFHGWPRQWVEAPPKFEDLGLIPGGNGYRMRKLRYEIVPGFFSTAILYEPQTMEGKLPAIVNVNGHVGPPGKSVEYKQKRCINQARRGILALNLEWIGFGELSHPENVHWFGAHLDLVGANAAGLFYLAMRKGLDYLAEHPNVDRARLGVTGLSGGGWQTIVLSALDERVAVAVPVAGYSSAVSRIERPQDVGDIEQNAADMLTVADYPHLTAMRAPRPTLLIYNAEDDCCFRGNLVRPYIFDAVRPFFALYGAADRFAWHLNTDPSDHNYQLDNRRQAYRFFTRHFRLPVTDEEIPVDAEIKSYQELIVGLPPGNLTILGLARKLASEIRQPDRAPDRERLRATIRYPRVQVERAWAATNTHRQGLETRSYRIDYDNGLSAAAVWARALSAGEPAPATVVLHDKGKRAAAAVAADRVNRGEQVLAADLALTGEAEPQNPTARGVAQLLATLGERALGHEAAQLAALARWLRTQGAPSVRVETTGIRSQLIALVAAAVEPGLFAEVRVRDGMHSLAHLLDAPVKYEEAPDLFCLDLYKEFDLDGLARLAAPTRVESL